MQTIKVKWTGFRPMLMHNGRLADRKDPIAKQINELNEEKGKNEARDEKRDRLEYEGALYYTPKTGPYIPADNIERCIQQGAAKIKKMKQAQAGVLCAEDSAEVPIEYTGPRKVDDMYKDPRFQLRKGVVIQRSRVIRVRPMIPTGWSITFELDYDEEVIDLKNLVTAMERAGSLIGLGDWRPKFGRFGVEVLKK